MSLTVNVITGDPVDYTVFNDSDLPAARASINCGFKIFKLLETGSHLAAGFCAAVGIATLTVAAPTAWNGNAYSLQTPLDISKQLGIYGGYCLAGAASFTLISKLMQKSTQYFDERLKTEIAADSTKWNFNTCKFSANLAAATSITSFFTGSFGIIPSVILVPVAFMGDCSEGCSTVLPGFMATGFALYGVGIALLPVWKVALVCKNYFKQ